ncbi:unnamed protein product [Urochloa humidicola]
MKVHAPVKFACSCSTKNQINATHGSGVVAPPSAGAPPQRCPCRVQHSQQAKEEDEVEVVYLVGRSLVVLRRSGGGFTDSP